METKVPREFYDDKDYSVNGPIRAVKALEDYVLQVIFEEGGIMNVPMKKQLSHPRLWALWDEKVFRNVDTDCRFVHWYRDDMEVAELAWEELIMFAIGKRWS